MSNEHTQKPTGAELEILRVLWERGPSTVRDVHEALREKKDLGYTTVLKLLQIMTTKGTVRRNEEQRAHVYEACQPATETKRFFFAGRRRHTSCGRDWSSDVCSSDLLMSELLDELAREPDTPRPFG